MKKWSLILSWLALVFFVGSGMAEAACVQTGKVSRLRTGVVGDVVDIAQPSDVPAFVTFYAVGSDVVFNTLLASALAANSTVIVFGNATSCPTTSFFRFGGNVLGVDVHRNE
jgi:hypothetical protein